MEILFLCLSLWETVPYLLHCPGAWFLSSSTLHLLLTSKLLIVLQDLHISVNLCLDDEHPP